MSTKRIATGDYRLPKVSPNGQTILVSGAKFRGLSIVEVETGKVRSLVGDARAGLTGQFLDNDRVRFSARRAGKSRNLVVGTHSSNVRVANASEQPQTFAVAQGNRVYVTDRGGQAQVATTGDRFFAPNPAPNSDWITFVGLATGIYLVHRESREVIHVGPGTSPAWSSAGDRIIFERTEDDGHFIVGSDLYVFELATRRLHRVTNTPGLIERRPSFAPDGIDVVFDDDNGSIYRGTLSAGAQ